MSLLSSSKIPLWVFILIIAVGSIIVLAVVVAVLRCWRIRSVRTRALRNTSQTPTRRVTVRRGRIVDSQHYLSLTGSKFGLNDVNDDIEARDPKARSRSPFEWWTSIRDRSQPRQSEMVQRSLRPSLQTQTSFSDQVHSSPSVDMPGSPARSSLGDPHSPTLSNASSPSKSRPTRNTNFSRAFRSHRPNDVPPSPSTRHLERLEEADDEDVHGAAEEVASATDKSPSLASTRELSHMPSRGPQIQPSFFRSSSNSFGSQPRSQTVHTPIPPPQPAQLPLPAQSGLRNQITRSTSSISSASSDVSVSYRQPAQQLPQRQASSSQPRESKSINDVQFRPAESQLDLRQDQRPVRSGSKKGKVLRKKSLKRAELTAMVQ